MNERPEMYKDMVKLEDLISHVSKHAAGIVICPQPIAGVVPCMSDGEDRTMLMTQWDKHEVEDIGLYKFDFLGLKTLTKLRRTVEAVRRNHGIELDLEHIDLEDPRLYETLNRGKMAGIFQFEGEAGELIIRRIKPRCFNDVIAAEALCRPGVKERDMYISNKELKDTNGSFPVPEYWDLVKDILEETYGAIVYQEQTMLLMHKLAGWSLGKADKMRKVKNLEEFREDFVHCCFNNNIDPAMANNIYSRFDLGYSFNKSHAAAYAINSMKTVYCKTYHFDEFMAAVMTIELDASKPCLQPMIKECITNGSIILPPDINYSTGQFEATQEGIRFPITLIKGVGGSAVDEIINKRPFENLGDFMCRVIKAKVKKNQVKNLIKAGCFDSTSTVNRTIMLNAIEPTEQIWTEELQRNYEVEAIGFPVTCSRLSRHQPTNWDDTNENQEISIPCIISEVKQTTDKNGREMAFLNIETPSEFISGVMFGRIYSLYKRALFNGKYCMIHGKKNNNSLVVETVSAL